MSRVTYKIKNAYVFSQLNKKEVPRAQASRPFPAPREPRRSWLPRDAASNRKTRTNAQIQIHTETQIIIQTIEHTQMHRNIYIYIYIYIYILQWKLKHK